MLFWRIIYDDDDDGDDAVKHAGYAVKHVLISWDATFHFCQMC